MKTKDRKVNVASPETPFHMSKRINLIGVFLILSSLVGTFIIIHPDKSDSDYIVMDDAFPALADLPESGHGTLISKQWVITAAHTVQSESLKELVINKKTRKVEKVIIHPGFQKPYAEIEENMEGLISLQQTPQKARSVIRAKEAMHDVALIKLSDPIEDVQPVKLNKGTDEITKEVTIFGKGANGNGRDGQYENAPNRQQLRQAQNRIVEAYDKWLLYKFDCTEEALPKEGVMGRGDSGGPVLLLEQGEWFLAGIASGVKWEGGDVTEFQYGVCKQHFYNTRVSYYIDWIRESINNG